MALKRFQPAPVGDGACQKPGLGMDFQKVLVKVAAILKSGMFLG
jgi:hypothetical protein